MTTHPTTPIGPDGEEPLSDLFSEIRSLADQVSSRISDDEVEARLRRVMRRAGQRGPTGADNAPTTVPFDSAAAESLLHQQLLVPPLRQLHEIMQAMAKVRCDLTAAGIEMRQMYAEAEKARAEAEKARAEAEKVKSDAQAYHDAALNNAATIIKEAKATVEEIRQAYADAAKVMSDTLAYQAAALHNVRSMTREAEAAAEEIRHAARGATDWEVHDLAKLLRCRTLNPTTSIANPGVWEVLANPVDTILRLLREKQSRENGAAAQPWAHNNAWRISFEHGTAAAYLWNQSSASAQSSTVGTSHHSSDLMTANESRGEVCHYELKLLPKIYFGESEITLYDPIQAPGRDPGDISQPRPMRSN